MIPNHPQPRSTSRIPQAAGLVLLLASGACVAPAQSPAPAWREALTFHASFDRGWDADIAAGDRRLYHAPSLEKRTEARAGLPADGLVALAKGRGRFGDALHFTQKKAPLVFFQAHKNLPYRAADWSGTVAFWLNTDPKADLASGFCDPIQITPRAWNDAAFFVEFEKRQTIPFRLGAYADFKVWNPLNRKWETIPFGEKPLVHVENPPFRGGKWTHVAFTFEHFNTGESNGVARLFLDGQPQGTLPPRLQTFTWDPAQTLVMLGVGYVGLFDELSVFNRALTAPEIQALHGVTASLGAPAN